MENIKAIFLDFDWTLFDHKTRSFNRKAVEALNQAHKKGVKLIINSARTFYSLKKLHTFELIPIDGFVVSNGGSCFFKDKTLYADFFADEVRDAVIKELGEHRLGFNLIGQYDTFIKVEDQRLVSDFYAVFYEPYPLDFSEYKGEHALAMQVFSTEEDDAFLKDLASRYHLLFNRFASNNVELTAKEFLKSAGIKTIYAALGLKREEAMAFGDDLNDIPMFEMVKYGICMGNGKDEAKKHAFYVTDTIENDGMYKALKHFGVID